MEAPSATMAKATLFNASKSKTSFPALLVTSAKAASPVIIPVMTAMIAVMAPSAGMIFSVLMVDNCVKASASNLIDAAMAVIETILNDLAKSLNELPISSSVFFRAPLKVDLSRSSPTSLSPLMSFLRPTRTPVNKPPLINDRI